MRNWKDRRMGKEEDKIQEETPYHENTKVRKHERKWVIKNHRPFFVLS
jgi:hypothetical protein